MAIYEDNILLKIDRSEFIIFKELVACYQDLSYEMMGMLLSRARLLPRVLKHVKLGAAYILIFKLSYF